MQNETIENPQIYKEREGDNVVILLSHLKDPKGERSITIFGDIDNISKEPILVYLPDEEFKEKYEISNEAGCGSCETGSCGSCNKV